MKKQKKKRGGLSMCDKKRTNEARKVLRFLGAAIAAALFIPGVASAQGRDQGSDRDRDRMTRIEPGTIIPVRTNDIIDADRRDDQVYTGIADQDVRGRNSRLAIPRGSPVELIVRVT